MTLYTIETSNYRPIFYVQQLFYRYSILLSYSGSGNYLATCIRSVMIFITVTLT